MLTLLRSARNPEVSDTTGDAICTTARNQKIFLLYLARMIRYWPLLLLLSLNASSQDATTFKPDSVRRTIAAVQTGAMLRIDGVLDEPEWNLATASSRFIQVEPFQGAAASFETVVKVLFNRQFLYVGIFSQDTAGRKAIRATDFKRDFNQLAHDLVSLSFDGFNDQRNAMNIASNAYGVQRDYLSFDDIYFDFDWDGLWRVRTNRTDSGWYAEMAIPWQTLRYKKTADSVQQWGFNVFRNRRLTNEVTAFSPFPRVFSASRMDYAGLLTNMKPPPPKPNIRIQPYVLTSYDKYTNIDTGKTTEAANTKLGGDIKWAINPNAVLDLTFNTDFAQADVDLQVNNITRFSVFFPERRQFFLENASLFSPSVQMAIDGSGGQMNFKPFFSRTIGLDAEGSPIPIVAGGRFVHRSTQRNYGAIVMRQQEQGSSPATNFFVGRYSENFGQQNRIGGLMTLKHTPDGTNTGSTIDGFFRLGESQSLNTILTHTATSATGTQGFAGIAQYYNATNHFKIWLTQSVVTKDFDPQMGFISRTDVIGTTPGMNFYYRGSKLPFKKLIRAYEPGFLPEFYWQASTGKYIEQSLNLWPIWLNFQNGAYFGYSVTPYYQQLTAPFEPLGITIAPGKYNYFQQWILFSTDPSKFISLAIDYKWGSYFNGRLQSGDYKLQFAPIPHISLIAQFNRNHFAEVGDNKTTSTVDLYILQGRFALNPRLQLTGFYQKNSLDNSQQYNIRFSWEYMPLSYLYIIYNHGGLETPQRVKQSEDHVIIKLSLLKQF